MKRANSVDDYIESAPQWQEELLRLREILKSTGLVETVKWGGPCYTHNDKLIVGVGAFKSYVGLWFFQGALLTDKDGVLMNAQKGRTQAMRQWRFEYIKEIKSTKIKAYVKEAIAIHESGQVIKPNRDKPVIVPPELEKALAGNKNANKQFQEFGKGKQRDYAEYIAEAKREDTKLKRLEKILPMITAGIGLHDKYKR